LIQALVFQRLLRLPQWITMRPATRERHDTPICTAAAATALSPRTARGIACEDREARLENQRLDQWLRAVVTGIVLIIVAVTKTFEARGSCSC